MSELGQLLHDYEDDILETYYDHFMSCNGADHYKKFLLSPRGRQRMRAYLKMIRLALQGDLESFLADQREASGSRALRGYELVGVIDSPLYLKRAVRDVIWKHYSSKAELLGRLLSDVGQLEMILDQARTVIANRYLEIRDEALSRHHQYINGLSELATAVHAGADPTWVLQVASRVIAQATGSLRCVILVTAEPGPEGSTFHVVSDGEAAGNSDVRDTRRVLARLSGPLPPGREVIAHVLHQRRSAAGLCTYYTPVVIRGRITGVIRVSVQHQRDLSEEHVHLLAALASSVAVILENTWLNQRVATLGAPEGAVPPVAGEIVGPSALSGREYQILQLVAEGCSNTQIGRRLVIEVNTVKTHLRRIFQRLGARDRANAVFIAAREGWLDLRKN
jgi:DNA-binding NarL/FixJ family response regulator